MDHYGGVYRQSGRGLGGMFRILGRVLVPILKRQASSFARKHVRRLGPKVLRAGVGMINDITSRKRNFKQAAKARGAQLVQDAINTQKPKRQRQSKKNPRKVKRQRKDIFS